MVFQVDVPDGAYEVIPTLGYLGSTAYTAAVLLDKTQVDLVTTTAGQVVSPSYVVEVSDDELTVEIQGAGSNSLAAMEGLQVLPLLFDMGPANQPVYTGAVPVSTTTTYSASQGYGWTSESSPGSVDNGDVSGSTQLTEDAVYGSSLTFQVNLPDGWYDVTPTLGDLGADALITAVYLQGAYLDNVPTAAGQVVSPTYLADVTGGQLTLEVTGAGSNDEAFLEGLAIAPADAPYQFDMGPTVNDQSGYGAVSVNTGYSSARGYGISGTGTYGSQDEGTAAGATPMDETNDYGQSLTFEMNLPDGSYEVIPTLGDVGNYAHTALVSLQGTQVATVSTAGDQTVSPLYVATVTNGLLTLGLTGSTANGGNGYAVIEGLEIIPLQFDMGPANQVVASGDTPVSNFTWYSTSQPYGLTAATGTNAQDLGMVVGSTAVTRDYIYGTSMTYEFGLPNGTYDVMPTLGYLANFSQTSIVYVQGTDVGTVATGPYVVDTPTYVATVTNGTLTLELVASTADGGDGYSIFDGLSIALQSGGEDAVIALKPRAATNVSTAAPVVQGGSAPAVQPIQTGARALPKPAVAISSAVAVQSTPTVASPPVAILGMGVITPADVEAASMAASSFGEGGAMEGARPAPSTDAAPSPINSVVDHVWTTLATTRARSVRRGLLSWIEEL